MVHPTRPTFRAAALTLTLVGCGGKAVVDGTAGDCPMPASLGQQECVDSPGLIVREGVYASGVHCREECDGTTCTWYENGEAACGCSQVDYSNSSAHGIPLCADWTPPWNWATLACEQVP